MKNQKIRMHLKKLLKENVKCTYHIYLLRDLDAVLDFDRRGLRSLESNLLLLRNLSLPWPLLLLDRLREDEGVRERLLRDLDRERDRDRDRDCERDRDRDLE